jgi:hypothetical protein
MVVDLRELNRFAQKKARDRRGLSLGKAAIT